MSRSSYFSSSAWCGLAAVLLFGLAVSTASAEGYGSDHKGASNTNRLIGGRPKPLADGLISVGGSTLRYLAPGARRWRKLHKQPGDNLYRTAVDQTRGRVLAAWEKDPFIHYIALGSKEHVVLKKPVAPSPGVRHFQVHRLAFLANGRDALVYMTAMMGSPSAAYRVALDGKSDPALLFQVESGQLLTAEAGGAIYGMPQNPRAKCDQRRCSVHSMVAYNISDDGNVTQKVLAAWKPTRVRNMFVRNASWVRGSDENRVTLSLLLADGTTVCLLRYRFGDDKAEFRNIGLQRWSAVSSHNDNYVSASLSGLDLQVSIGKLTPGSPAARTIRLPSRDNYKTDIHGLGVRANGSIWVHWHNHLLLFDGNRVPRAVSLERLARGSIEWAGAAVYVEKPESLWIGIESGPSRNYARVSFADIERRAKPWQPVAGKRQPVAAKPRGCKRLPSVRTLKTWPVRVLTPNCGPARGPRPNTRNPPPRRKPYKVAKVLGDGTQIVDGRELGCIRVRHVSCSQRRGGYKKCLPPVTHIATPNGEVRVDELRVGMPVWTQDRQGNKILGTIVQTHRESVAQSHEMIQIRLADGRSLTASSGHPTRDGTGMEKLKPGGVYDGSKVIEVNVVGYPHPETFDILPSGDTGIYWANGVPIGSTLRPLD